MQWPDATWGFKRTIYFNQQIVLLLQCIGDIELKTLEISYMLTDKLFVNPDISLIIDGVKNECSHLVDTQFWGRKVSGIPKRTLMSDTCAVPVCWHGNGFPLLRRDRHLRNVVKGRVRIMILPLTIRRQLL